MGWNWPSSTGIHLPLGPLISEQSTACKQQLSSPHPINGLLAITILAALSASGAYKHLAVRRYLVWRFSDFLCLKLGTEEVVAGY
jgi:hypothetical protein